MSAQEEEEAEDWKIKNKQKNFLEKVRSLFLMLLMFLVFCVLFHVHKFFSKSVEFKAL